MSYGQGGYGGQQGGGYDPNYPPQGQGYGGQQGYGKLHSAME